MRCNPGVGLQQVEITGFRTAPLSSSSIAGGAGMVPAMHVKDRALRAYSQRYTPCLISLLLILSKLANFIAQQIGSQGEALAGNIILNHIDHDIMAAGGEGKLVIYASLHQDFEIGGGTGRI